MVNRVTEVNIMDLNIKRVSRESVQRLKVEAAERNCTLRSLCLERLGIEGENGTNQNDDAGTGGSCEAGAAQRKGNRAAVPVLSAAKGEEVGLHQMQPVPDELAGRGDAPSELPKQGPASSAKGSCPHGKFNAAYCRATGGGC